MSNISTLNSHLLWQVEITATMQQLIQSCYDEINRLEPEGHMPVTLACELAAVRLHEAMDDVQRLFEEGRVEEARRGL